MTQASTELGRAGKIWATHLNEMQHVTKDGTLFASVRLGPVLVAVCGQGFQFGTQQVCVLVEKILLWQK